MNVRSSFTCTSACATNCGVCVVVASSEKCSLAASKSDATNGMPKISCTGGTAIRPVTLQHTPCPVKQNRAASNARSAEVLCRNLTVGRLLLLGGAPLLGLKGSEVEGLLQTHHVAGTYGLESGGLATQLLGIVVHSLDGKTDAALHLVHLDDASLDFVAHLDDVLHALHVLLGKLGDVDEAVDVAVQVDEGTEGSNLGNLTGNEIAHLEAVVDALPGVERIDGKVSSWRLPLQRYARTDGAYRRL